jgi:hypothetical protein
VHRIFSFDLIQICRIDWRGEHFDYRFVCGRHGPRARFDAQDIRWISVLFVNGCAYSFVH